MNDRQAESTQVIKKIDNWIEFLSLIRQLAQEEASVEADDTFISTTIEELINKVGEAYDRDDTIQHSTLRFEHNSGRVVAFGLTCELAKPGVDEEDEYGL